MSKRSKKSRVFRIRRRTQAGSAPGMVVVDPTQPKPQISVMAYGPENLVEQPITDLTQIPKILAENPVTWIDVEGLGDAAVVEGLGTLFNLHRLALEDVVNLHQRSKVEEYGDVLFIVLRMVRFEERCSTEQISIFVGANFVLTFQEGHPGDSLERVRTRIREKSCRMRSSGPDYLAYTMIDGVIDGYYPVLEQYAERLDALEDQVLNGPNTDVFNRLHEVKSDLLLLRRAIWPQREAIARLAREDNALFGSQTQPYLRDCYDHIVQIVDLVETYRELTADLRDLYMSSISNRINETMRVLTIISTIFIPITFIAGVYGMNFNPDSSPWNMPELNWYLGYPLAWLAMLLTALGMVIYFFRQGWILQSLRRR